MMKDIALRMPGNEEQKEVSLVHALRNIKVEDGREAMASGGTIKQIFEQKPSLTVAARYTGWCYNGPLEITDSFCAHRRVRYIERALYTHQQYALRCRWL